MDSKIKIFAFSGGKDSTAMLLWGIEKKYDYQTIFCDTGWENPLTYAFVQEINQKYLNNKLITLRSDKYEGFVDLCIKRKRVPSTMRRFCTEELKIFPTKKYIDYLQSKGNYVFLFQGIRASESRKRALLKRNIYDADFYKCTIKRPLLYWSSDDVFAIHKKFKQEPNRLYKMGMKRVGCFPCIMVSKPELKNIFTQFLLVKNYLKDLEQKLGRTFFPSGYIPINFCSRSVEVEEPVYKHIVQPPLLNFYDKEFYNRPENLEIIGFKKVIKKIPTVEDVYKYIMDDPNQLNLEINEEPGTCFSYYNICE